MDDDKKLWSPSDEKDKTDDSGHLPIYVVHMEIDLDEIELDPEIFDVDNWF